MQIISLCSIFLVAQLTINTPIIVNLSIKCPTIIFKNSHNEILKDSISYSDSIISFQIVGENSIDYEVKKIEITDAEDRRMISGISIFTPIKNDSSFNIGSKLRSILRRREEQKNEKKTISEAINKPLRRHRVIVELVMVLSKDREKELTESCKSEIKTFYVR